MKKYKSIFIIATAAVLALIIAFSYGPEPTEKKTGGDEPQIPEKTVVKHKVTTIEVPYEEEPSEPEEIPEASKPEERKAQESHEKKEQTCTLSVRCDTVLNNLDLLDEDKVGIIPKDGIILGEKTVTINEGDSVFDVLQRELKDNNIHLEFVKTPAFNSAYIEGIANLYEFDCGELSGWMYKVNGEVPDYGCSLYYLKDGDKVEWVYTCDLGADIGG